MLTRATELRALVKALKPQMLQPPGQTGDGQTVTDAHPETVAAMCEAIERHVRCAEQAATTRFLQRWRTALNGAAIERASSNLDAAEVNLLRIAPNAYVSGQLPSLLVKVQEHLPKEDHRRRRLEELAFGDHERNRELQPWERNAIVAAARGSYSAGRREIMRVRSFRNVVLTSATVLLGATFMLAGIGAWRPAALPLCFIPTVQMQTASAAEPTEDPADSAGNAPADERARRFVVCPTERSELVTPAEDVGARTTSSADEQRPTNVDPRDDEDNAVAETVSRIDVGLVAMVGLMAAGLSAAVSLRRVRGTSAPYSLPVALALLKLPTGALTAVLGLLLLRGEFIPGLSALDSPAQIIAWAALLGYAQQALTRYVDQRAQAILDATGRGTKSPED